jgi:ubiquitin C-terminal hydrolase
MRESEKLYQGFPSTGIVRREERPYRTETVERAKQDAKPGAVDRTKQEVKPEAVEKTKQEAKPALTHVSGQFDSATKPKQEEQRPLKPEYQSFIMTSGQMSSKNQDFKPKPMAEVSSKPAEAVISPSPILTHDPVPVPRSDLINPSSSHLTSPPTQPFLTPKKDSPDSLASQSTTETVTRPPSARKRQDFSTNAMSTMTAFRADDTVVAGLRNFGNVCFMNAVLQCLSFTPRIEEAIQGSINEAAKTEGELVRAVRELLVDMRQGRYATLSVTKVKEVISTVAPQFRDYTQHDAQEFLRVLLDALHEELNRGSKAVKAPKLSRTLENPQKLDDLASIWWQENLRRDSSGLTDLFQGQLMHILTCGNCHNSTYTFEVFLDLSLPIPVTERSRYSNVVCSLQQCFEEFTSEKEIEGVKCKRCGPQVCKGKMLVHRFPKVLVLHLKRFTMEIDSDGKIKAPVTCPASQLDLSKYTLRVPSPRYDLYAIAHHIGDIDYGHYYA